MNSRLGNESRLRGLHSSREGGFRFVDLGFHPGKSRLERDHRDAVTALALLARAERLHRRMLAKVVRDELAERSGAAAVDDSRLLQAGGVGVVHVAVEQG